MKWYKHDTNANMDSKLQEVLLDYGLEGYGLYWYCLELIAANVTPEKLTFELEHDARIIARNTGSSVEKVQQMMTKFVELKLFESIEGRVTCFKIARRADDYTAKLLKTQTVDLKQLSNDVGESPTKSDKNEKRPPKRKENKINKNNIGRFKKPSLEECKTYLAEIGTDKTAIDDHANRFINHFESVGWVVGAGGNPMQDWQSSLKGWVMRSKDFNSFGKHGPKQETSSHQSHKIYERPDQPAEIIDPEAAKHALQLAKQSIRRMP